MEALCEAVVVRGVPFGLSARLRKGNDSGHRVCGALEASVEFQTAVRIEFVPCEIVGVVCEFRCGRLAAARGTLLWWFLPDREADAHRVHIQPLDVGDQTQTWLDVRFLCLLACLLGFSPAAGGGDHLAWYWSATTAAALRHVCIWLCLALR